jgi:hypothetical protein
LDGKTSLGESWTERDTSVSNGGVVKDEQTVAQ